MYLDSNMGPQETILIKNSGERHLIGILAWLVTSVSYHQDAENFCPFCSQENGQLRCFSFHSKYNDCRTP